MSGLLRTDAVVANEVGLSICLNAQVKPPPEQVNGESYLCYAKIHLSVSKLKHTDLKNVSTNFGYDRGRTYVLIYSDARTFPKS